jgi:hypothetical protein
MVDGGDAYRKISLPVINTKTIAIFSKIIV